MTAYRWVIESKSGLRFTTVSTSRPVLKAGEKLVACCGKLEPAPTTGKECLRDNVLRG